jgi:hypothetical protein
VKNEVHLLSSAPLLYITTKKVDGHEVRAFSLAQSLSRAASCSLCLLSFSSFLNSFDVVYTSMPSGRLLTAFFGTRRLFREGLVINVIQ